MKATQKENLNTVVTSLPAKPLFYPFMFLAGIMFLMISCRKGDFNPPPVGSYDLKLIADNLVSPITV